MKADPDALLRSMRPQTDAKSRLALAAKQPEPAPATEFRPVETPSVVGQVVPVPLTQLRSNPFNARRIYSDKRIEVLAHSLREQGQDVPALATPRDEGYVLIDGEYRLRAARRAGLPVLKVIVRTGTTDAQLYEVSRRVNEERTPQTPLDDALAFRDLLERKVYPDQRALSQALNKSESTVSETLTLAELPEELAEACVNSPSLSTFRALRAIRNYYKAKGTAEALELVSEALKKDLSARELEERVKAREGGPRRRPRAEKREVAWKGGKGEVRVFPNGRVEFKLEGLSEDDAHGLADRLEQLLKPRARSSPA